MYKFNNGIVVFSKEDRDRFIKAGLKLVKEKNENNNNDRVVKAEFRKVNKTSK